MKLTAYSAWFKSWLEERGPALRTDATMKSLTSVSVGWETESLSANVE